MLLAAREFCRDVRDNPLKPYWLSYVGSTGSGKTHLAKAIYRWICLNVRPPVAGLDTGSCIVDVPGNEKHPWEKWASAKGFIDWRKLCARLRAGEWDEANWLEDAWLVVLDDIGVEYDPNGLLTATLDRIINGRLRKWTVITCNFTLAQIAEKFDVRIASRMQRDDSKVIEVDAMDYSLR